MFKTAMFTELADNGMSRVEPVSVVVRCDGRFLTIHVAGYGDCACSYPDGSPVALEIYKGELRLLVNDDINQDECKIISLQGARENERICDDDDDEE